MTPRAPVLVGPGSHEDSVAGVGSMLEASELPSDPCEPAFSDMLFGSGRFWGRPEARRLIQTDLRRVLEEAWHHVETMLQEWALDEFLTWGIGRHALVVIMASATPLTPSKHHAGVHDSHLCTG